MLTRWKQMKQEVTGSESSVPPSTVHYSVKKGDDPVTVPLFR